MKETDSKDRTQKQTKQTKRQGSRLETKMTSPENKDSPSSSQTYRNTDENTHDS